MGDRRWEIGDRLRELTLLMTLRPNWRTRPSRAPSMSERNSCQSSAATGEMKLAQNGRFEMGS
ncbi:MAG TPA: hypothetical protein PLI29_10740, partial [Verrucomicrobiota bacterium]|nr:hypothetical protein [Verrucomicrobiota bacterium]